MTQPLISVVLATRDRPVLFEQALDSVLNQTYSHFEVVVVNDGSAPEHLARYQAIFERARARLGARFNAHSLLRRPKGHGSSYSLNVGVVHASGDYLCFLDDDDKWIDLQHLTRVACAIDAASAEGKEVDLYMANQDAWINDSHRLGPLWLGKLEGELTGHGHMPDDRGCFAVTVEDLMATPGFCHLNCMTVRRALFEQSGGLDEGIRWENDHEFFLRLIDQAGLMLFHPAVMSYHRVPDPNKQSNITTSLSELGRRQFQSRAFDLTLMRTQHPAVRRYARLHKVYALERIAIGFADSNDWIAASFYAAQALGGRPSLGRASLLLRCWMHRMIPRM